METQAVATPEERMMNFLDVEDTPPENLDEEKEEVIEEEASGEEVEVEDEVDVEEEKEETVEPEPPRKLKLKHNGEEIEKDENEVINLAQQGFDYNVKMHQLKQERAELEAQAQAVKLQTQLQSAMMQEFAKVTAIDDQLSQYQQVDWNALSDADPVQAQKLFFQFNQLQSQRNQLATEIQQKQQYIIQAEQQAIEQKFLKGKEVLAKEIPQWGPEIQKSLRATAHDYGFSDQELKALVDPRQVKVLHDAMQWRKLQSEKTVTQKKVATASPVVKPGSKDTKTANQSQVKKAREELRRTGRSEYAAKLIERTL